MPRESKTASPDDTASKYRAPALEKGLDILELMARNSYPMKASQMAGTLGRSLSELFRMIQVLEYRGYIRLADSKEGYVLSNKLFTLGMSQPPTQSLIHAALPVMEELAIKTGQSCHLVVPSEDQIVVIARVESPTDLSFSVRVGYRRNLLDTTSGPVLFSTLPEAERQRWIERLQASGGERSIEAFLAMAEDVSKRGYVKAHSDFVEGITDLSAPVGNRGPVAAVTIPFVHRKPLTCPIDSAVKHLVAATSQITEALQSAL